jgi:glycosyltransferase involved in cell wall biosynthesis
VPLQNSLGRLLHGSRLNAVANAQSRTQADIVFFNCFDEVSSALFRRTSFGLPPPRNLAGRVSGVFVRPRVADQRLRVGFLKRFGFRRLYQRRWFRRLLVLDEMLPDHLLPGLQRSDFAAIPDPWEGDFSISREDARRKLGLPQEKYLYLHYGTASPRKGLPTVVKASSYIHSAENCALLAAGRFSGRDATDQPLLKKLAEEGRAYLFDRYIEDAEEPLFFRACDAVVLAYEGHYGSSAIQSRAAAADRPVISSDEGLVGSRTKTHRLGLTFKTGDAHALAETILHARNETPEVLAPGLRDYANLHSRETFRAALLNNL